MSKAWFHSHHTVLLKRYNVSLYQYSGTLLELALLSQHQCKVCPQPLYSNRPLVLFHIFIFRPEQLATMLPNDFRGHDGEKLMSGECHASSWWWWIVLNVIHNQSFILSLSLFPAFVPHFYLHSLFSCLHIPYAFVPLMHFILWPSNSPSVCERSFA